MPINKRDDSAPELRELIDRIEPPQSPKHLDEAILRHARSKAETLKAQQPARSGWFQIAWQPAVALASVAALAVSLSVQIFDTELDDPATSLLERTAPTSDASPAVPVAESRRRVQAADAGNASAARSGGAGDSAQAEESRQSLAPRVAEATLAAPADSVTEEIMELAPASPQDRSQSNTIESGLNLEAERQATPVEAAADRFTAPLQEHAAPVAESDPSSLSALTAALAFALLGEGSDDSDTDTAQTSRPSLELRESILSAYAELEAASAASVAAQARYHQAREQADAVDLPETVAAAVELLRAQN